MKKGFTLIELLVVVAIIGVLASVVFAALNASRSKGVDAAIKANLKNAVSQAEIFYTLNTAAPNTYTGVCTDPGPVGGAVTVAAQIAAAGKAYGKAAPYFLVNDNASHGLPPYSAQCNDSANAWAAEVPLKTSNHFWCVDSNGKAEDVTGAKLTAANDYLCQ